MDMPNHFLKYNATLFGTRSLIFRICAIFGETPQKWALQEKNDLNYLSEPDAVFLAFGEKIPLLTQRKQL